MLDGEVAHEIEVDVRRYVDGVFLEPESAVIHDIQVSRKTVTLRVHRHERQVNTRITVHHDGIHDIVLVERYCERRTERRYEPVEQQVHAVVVDIYILEDGVDVLLEGLRTDHALDTENTFLVQHFLLPVRAFLVVFGVQVLADTHRHVRIDTRRVNVFLHKREITPERFLPVHLDVVQRKRHAAVAFCRVLIYGCHAERVLAGDHVLDQFYSRVALATVVALAVLGSHHYILQSVHIRSQLHLHVLAVLTLPKSQHLRLVT